MIPKPRRIATVAVWRGQELLMGLRQDNMKWTFPGGHLDEAESPIAGAQRELYEETGISVFPEELSYLGSAQTQSMRSGEPLEVHMFQVDAGDRLPVTGMDPDDEVHGWSWVSVSNGLPSGLAERLHVPKNFLLRALGLQDFTDEATKLASSSGKHIAPMSVRRDAAEGLRAMAMAGVKADELSIKRARALVEGRPMSEKDVHDAAAYFSLYGSFVGENDQDGKPTKRAVEAMLWGGGAGARWAQAMSSTLKSGSFRLSASSDGETQKSGRTIQEVTADIRGAGEKKKEKEEVVEPPAPKKKTPDEMKSDPSEALEGEDEEE